MNTNRNTSTKKHMSAEALAKLAAARAVMAGSGVSPRARGTEKTQIALDWIYRWGWSSPGILDLVTGGLRTGLATRLVKQKLLTSTRTESGGGIKDIPISILTLTTSGIHEVERLREDLLKYEVDPFRIDQTKLRHDQIAQRATANALKSGAISVFRTPAELATQSAKDVKQPDILWIDQANQRIGIEVELSAKWDRKLDQFINSCLESLNPTTKDKKSNHVDVVALVSDSKAILKRYSEAFKPGAPLTIWGKNERGFWGEVKTTEIPAWAEGKIICKFLD
jgi:hypothetical protein